MLFIIKQPETDDEFEQYYSLRWQILRKPWAQPQGSEKDDIESSCFHFIAVATSSKNVDTISVSTLIESAKIESAKIESAQKQNTVIGVSRLQFNTKKGALNSTPATHTSAQIRYMAVSPTFRNKGIARALIAAMEAVIKNCDGNNVTLDAREPAVGFYEKLGYRVSAKSYLLFDEIQHYKMEKTLSPPSPNKPGQNAF